MNTKRTPLTIFILIITAGGGFFLGQLLSSNSDDTSARADSERKILYWQSPMNPEEIYDRPGKSTMGMDLVAVYEDETPDQELSSSTTERKILYWQAPMNPTEIYDRPGTSVMGMDLIPVYDDGAAGVAEGIVSIDPVTVQNMGIRTENVIIKDFSRVIRTVGEVKYDEERLYLVNAKISGWIEKLYVNFVGAEVTEGDPLLEIYSPELVTTQEEYLLAVRNHEKISETDYPVAHLDAAKLLASVRKRLEYWDIPESEILRLEETREVRKTIVLPAPETGIVVQKYAIEGAFIEAGMDLFQIADLRTVWVHASFYDNEVPWISEGQSVEMELSYIPGKTYKGRVSYIYPFLREKARDVHVRLIFSNPNLDLKPGMYANIRLTGRTIPDALIIPSEAVIRSGERAIVFVDRGQGRFEPREIRIGEVGGAGNASIRVLSGLLEGESVVISAQFMLDSESRLQEAIQKMLAARQSSTSSENNGDLPTEMPDMDSDDAARDSLNMDMEADTTRPPEEATEDATAPDTMPTMDHSAQPDTTHSGQQVL
ncbi:MAG: efflux RND transporter periplasmic adaptor subunit [Bacteroidetes bacterium]|nr:efflux RND transporter periplasmic adaptor subunit [Bacteroidota bacterium]